MWQVLDEIISAVVELRPQGLQGVEHLPADVSTIIDDDVEFAASLFDPSFQHCRVGLVTRHGLDTMQLVFFFGLLGHILR